MREVFRNAVPLTTGQPEKGETKMKKYIFALLVLCFIEGLDDRQNVDQPKVQQDRITAAIEIQTADGPAYLVCVETTDDKLTTDSSGVLQGSNANFLPDSAIVMLLALCGYLLGGRRR
jgi:hypothetical protein